MALMLLADPDESRVMGYLGHSRVFVRLAPSAIGVLLLRASDDRSCEIMNLAVHPDREREGHGAALIAHAIEAARSSGASRLLVGTGETSLGPLKLYRRFGFEIVGRVQGFFESYDPPVVENGMLCRDMLLLKLQL
jgi:ribosomal protein S18 acetylase RimI-like enzyme